MKVVAAGLLAVAFAGAVLAFGSGEGQPAPIKSAPQGAPAPQPPVPPTDPVMVGPRQPGGLLGDRLGEYITIEGIRAEGGKIETGTLLVDRVNGKVLDTPIAVLVRVHNFDRTRFDLPTEFVIPPKQRCVFKGFESGQMIGVPQGVYDAAKELQRTDVPMSPTAWRWRPYFVALVVVKPEPAGPKK